MKYDEKLLNLFLPFPLKSAESFGPPFLLDLLLNNLNFFNLHYTKRFSPHD